MDSPVIPYRPRHTAPAVPLHGESRRKGLHELNARGEPLLKISVVLRQKTVSE